MSALETPHGKFIVNLIKILATEYPLDEATRKAKAWASPAWRHVARAVEHEDFVKGFYVK